MHCDAAFRHRISAPERDGGRETAATQDEERDAGRETAATQDEERDAGRRTAATQDEERDAAAPRNGRQSVSREVTVVRSETRAIGGVTTARSDKRRGTAGERGLPERGRDSRRACPPYLRGHSPTSMSRMASPSTVKRTAVRSLWMPKHPAAPGFTCSRSYTGS